MKTKLIMIEGLPSSGKSTIAQITDEILNENETVHKIFYEGNLDHPADYDGVSFLNFQEFNELICKYEKYSDLIKMNSIRKDENFLIPYANIKNKLGTQFPNELLNDIVKYDIYELPLDTHIDLILDRWMNFADNAMQGKSTYIFECCFIQNPITVSMLRDNSRKEITINYIKRLAKIIEPLNPILLYVDTISVEQSFRKVFVERPDSWLEGFIYYYTKRGFGKANKKDGIEGTIEVLKSRKALELEILDILDMKKQIIDNSLYDYKKTKKEISNIIKNSLYLKEMK